MNTRRTFLSYVAEDLLSRFGKDLAHVAVVFPNKRAALFLNQELARQAGHAVWSPAYVTISELFRSQCEWQVAAPIKTVCDLYRTYVEVTGTAETLDRFYSWGQLLLADFDDLDKNMAEARQVFRNITDLHEMDDLSYLSDKQRELIARFFSNFRTDEDINSELRRNFLKVWSRLHDVYERFRERLETQGLAYEGMLYRHVAEQPTLHFEYKHYVFVGFNVLQEVEKMLFTRLQRDGKATFYWNFDRYYVPEKGEPSSEAGVYVRQWLDRFPNALDGSRKEIYDNFVSDKQISFVGAPTEDIQARYVATWLRENNRYLAGNRTAIVLADESLLGTVIHSIPPEVGELNVTTGYPLSRTPIATLVNLLLNAQLHGYRRDRGCYRLREVNSVLRHPYAQLLHPQAADIQKELLGNHRYHPSANEVPFLAKEPDITLAQWLRNSVESVAKSDLKPKNNALFDESVFRMFTLLTRLSDLVASGDLTVDDITFQRLVQQLVADTTVPFHGKPAVGVQVMGVLETRNLDFDHVLVLSCNEGNLPRGVDDNSFIPHALRKAYGLTTIDNKVAIYSYYFHALLQRAQDVTLVYNTSADGTGGGAMSRFMLQLLTEFPLPIRQQSLLAAQQTITTQKTPQEKDESVMAKLAGIHQLSPSAFISYLTCPKKYFYKYVADLKEDDTDEDDTIDNRLFGNIFHKAAQLVYESLLPKEMITKEDIEKLLTRKGALDGVLDEAFNIELFKLKEGTHRKPTLDGMQLINREVIEKYLRRLLRIDHALAPFQVIAHEEDVESLPLDINGRQLRIKGRIDRLDRINIGTPSECLRVVDYKTGSREAGKMNDVVSIFEASNFESKHSDYIMQAMAYSLIVATNAPKLNPKKLPVRPALFFIQRAGEGYDPTIIINKQPVVDVRLYANDFWDVAKEHLASLFAPDVPFEPTGSERACKNCPYMEMCGEQ